MLLGAVVWVAGIVVKVAACLEGTHGCLLEGGTGEAGEAGAAEQYRVFTRQAVASCSSSCLCETVDSCYIASST